MDERDKWNVKNNIKKIFKNTCSGRCEDKGNTFDKGY
jgi:hypothetical protein